MQTKKGKNSWLFIFITANGVLNFATQANIALALKADLDIKQVCAVSNIALSQIRLEKHQRCNRYQYEIINRKKNRINQEPSDRGIFPHKKFSHKKALLKKTSILDRIEQFRSKHQKLTPSIPDVKNQVIITQGKDIKVTKIAPNNNCINTEPKNSGIKNQGIKVESTNSSHFCSNQMNQAILSKSQAHKTNQSIVSDSRSFYLLSQTTGAPPTTESPVQNESPQNQQNPTPLEKNSQLADPPPVEGEPANINNNPSPTEIEKKLDTTESAESKKFERLLQQLEKNKQSIVNSTDEKNKQPNANGDIDIELGEFRVLERPLEQLPIPKQSVAKFKPIGSLLARFGYFQTSNIFSAEIDPEVDGLFYSGLTLSSVPLKLGGKTYLRSSIDGNIFRYMNQSDFNYNQLRFNLGIFQRLSSKMYAELGWRNQQLFYARDSDRFNIASGDKFLNENAFRLSLGRRDSLSKKLILDSFYELRVSLTDLPAKRDRIVNYLSVFLNYYLQKPLQVGFGYQFNYSDFTERTRQDQYHRLLANLNYKISDDSNISVQTGVSLGSSTQENIDFDGWFFSINYNLELGKF